MIHKMYSIHDQATKEFHIPIPQKTHGEAERTFRSEVNNDRNGNLYKYPEQYNLFYIGDYDSETGKMHALEAPFHVISGAQVKATLTDDQRQMKLAGT